MTPVSSAVLRICLLTVAQYLVPGAALASLILVIALFETAVRAEYLQMVAVGALFITALVGILRAFWIYLVYRSRRSRR